MIRTLDGLERRLSYVNVTKRVLGGVTITLAMAALVSWPTLASRLSTVTFLFVATNPAAAVALNLLTIAALNRVSRWALWVVIPLQLGLAFYFVAPRVFFLVRDVPVASLLFAFATPFLLISLYLYYLIFAGLVSAATCDRFGKSLLRTIAAGRATLRVLGLPPHVGLVRAGRRVVPIAGLIGSALAFGFGLFSLLASYRTLSAVIDVNVRYPGIRLSIWNISDVLLIEIAAGLVALAVSAFLARLARRALRISLKEMTEIDRRRHILFLRPFFDDQIRLTRSRGTLVDRIFSTERKNQTYDEILLIEGSLRGPVVALGNPQDQIQPYGAVRGYFSWIEWKDAVSQLLAGASAIVICMSDTDNIWWEVEQIDNGAHLDRTLFVFGPRIEPMEKIRIMRRLERIPHLQNLEAISQAAETDQPSAGVIGFFVDQLGELQVAVSSSAGHLGYVLLTRWFLRNLPAPPPGPAAATT